MKCYKQHVIATLLFTASVSTYGAGSNPFDYGMEGSNSAAGILEAVTTQTINGIHIQRVLPNNPVTEPVRSIDGATALGMTLSPEEAFNFLCYRMIKTSATDVDGLTNLFCGQISSAHINQTPHQINQTFYETTSVTASTMQISRSVQLIRVVHTLLSHYDPERANELFNACVINAVPEQAREIYIYVPQELANRLLQLGANGMYIGRNVLFVSNTENGRAQLKERFDAIAKGMLPGNVPKSPLVIELGTQQQPLPSKNIATDSNTTHSSAKNSRAGINPRRKSDKSSVGKKEPRSKKDLTIPIGTNPAATTRLLKASKNTGSNSAAGILEAVTSQTINGINIQNVLADDPFTEPVSNIEGATALGMTLPPEKALDLLFYRMMKTSATDVDGLTNLFCGQISSAHINQTPHQIYRTFYETTSVKIKMCPMQISRSVQLIRVLHTLLSHYDPERADELFNACVINAVAGRAREIFIYVPQELANLLLPLSGNGMYIGRNVLFVSNTENGRAQLKERFDSTVKGMLPGNVPKSPLVIELATLQQPLPSKNIATDSNTTHSSAKNSRPGINPRRKSDKSSVGKKEPRSKKDLTIPIGTNPAATTRLLKASKRQVQMLYP